MNEVKIDCEGKDLYIAEQYAGTGGKGASITVGMVAYDISRVRRHNPLAILGRVLGGCNLCGSLFSDLWHCCLPNSELLCDKCWHKYIQHDLDSRTCLYPECEGHPYHGKIRRA
jgi:hypothetical protein